MGGAGVERNGWLRLRIELGVRRKMSTATVGNTTITNVIGIGIIAVVYRIVTIVNVVINNTVIAAVTWT